MDRGFGSFRGTGYGGSGSGPNRQVSDRRYDDFYSDSRRGGRNGGAVNNRNRNSGEWGGSNRDRGFFNQSQGGGGRDRGSGNAGQMLAAIQQQQNLLSAFMTQQRSGGILSHPRGNNTFGQGGRQSGGRYGSRPGDKRRQDNAPPFQNKRPDRRPAADRRNQSSGKSVHALPLASSRPKSTSQEKSKVKSPSPRKEEEIDIPDDQVEVPDSLMDSVEKLRQRKDVDRNVADEDVKKLSVFCFNGKSFECLTCGTLFSKEPAFLHHLDSKSHIMKVIDNRSAKKYQAVRDILDIDLSPDDWYEKNDKARAIILKQAKMLMKTQMEIKQREVDNYNKNPVNFFNVAMETRKAAVKSGETVTIKSIVETTMEVKEFAGDRFFGCEFIKAIAGFNCRLCGLHIKDADSVLPHIESRLHKSNYQFHLRKNPGYEKLQKEQNKELSDALAEHEDSFILLSESAKAESQTFLAVMETHLTRVPKLFKPDTSETNAEDKEKATENKEEPEVTIKKEEAEKVNEEEDKHTNLAENQEIEVKSEAMEEQQEKETAEDEKEQESEMADAPDNVDADPETSTEVKPEEDEVEKNCEAEEEAPAEVKESPVKKAATKKTPNRARGGAASKRGRGRGKVTASPRARVKKAKEEEIKTETPELSQEDSTDGSFMDSFHVVDEVEEDN